MKHFLKSFSLQLGVFVSVIATLGVVYAAWNDTVSTGTPLSSASWNTLVGKVNDMDNALSFSGVNVAIGTSSFSPEAILHLKAALPYIVLEDSDDTNGSYGAIHSYQDGGLYYDANRNNSATLGSHHFRVDGATERMTILNNGNVGIGTVNPDANLHIVADSLPILKLTDVGLPTYGMKIGVAGGGNHLGLGTEAGNFEHLVIRSGGYVGIGDTTPSQKLDVNGNIAVNGSTVHTSDKRLKKNIKDLSNSLNKVLEMRGVSYEWKNQSNDNMRGVKVGVIAQELELIFPEAITTANDEMQSKSVDYNALIPVLIEAIKELKVEKNSEIKKLQEEIEILKSNF